MALIAESKTANIIKSLNTYFYASFITTLGYEVHFPDRPGIFTPSGARWIRLDYILGTFRSFMGAVSGSNKGNLTSGFININCCELIAKRTDPYALYGVRDAVHGYVTDGTSIACHDYDTVGNPTAGYIMVTGVSESQVADGLGEGENGIAIRNLSATVNYLEAYS